MSPKQKSVSVLLARAFFFCSEVSICCREGLPGPGAASILLTFPDATIEESSSCFEITGRADVLSLPVGSCATNSAVPADKGTVVLRILTLDSLACSAHHLTSRILACSPCLPRSSLGKLCLGLFKLVQLSTAIVFGTAGQLLLL